MRSRHAKRLEAVLLAACVTVSCAFAQDTSRPALDPGPGEHAATTAPSPPARRASSDITFPAPRHPHVESPVLTPQPGTPILLYKKDGQLVWTVNGATFEQYMDFLRSKQSAQHNEPEYSISSVALTGTCDDERAQLTAKFDIQVERDGVWLAVPLGMQEGNPVSAPRQTGAGEFRAPPFDRITGCTVYLRGKGLHEVFVPIVVTIRRQLNQRHLQLTIPPAAASQITLRVPKQHCQVKPIEGAHVFPKPIPHGTRIEAYGIKGQFDLSWDVPVNEPQARTVFDVASKCTLGMDADRIQLHVVQTIDPKQGTVSSVRVRMPAGFRTISGQQKDVDDTKKYTAANVDTAGFIKVNLKPSQSGRAELTWDLEDRQAPGAPIVIRGFDIAGARNESGDLALIPAEGYHFEVRSGDNLRRINGLGAGLAESTYTFTQPFRLELSLEEIRPQFSVEPTLYLLLSEQRAELSGQFHIQIRQGAVRAVTCQWPDWKKQGWTIDPHDVSENAELLPADAKDPAAGNTVHFRLSGRLGNDFIFSFRAVRSIPRQGTPFHLTLPVMDATVRPASAVVVADAENVKSTLDPLSETAVRPIPPERREALSVPEAFRGLRQVALRVDSPVQAFEASVAVQKQQIETESTAQVEVQEGRLQVTQRISYHVSFERLAEAVLVLPKQLRRSDVQIYVDRSDTDFEAIPIWTPGDADTGDVARIAFEPHRIGSFDLFARYFVPLAEPTPNEASSEVSVPLLRSRDAAFKAMRVELRARDDTEVEVTDESWSPQIPQISPDKGSTHAWTVAGDRTSIPLRLLRIASTAAPRVKIAKAYLRSTVDVTGVVATIAWYRIEGPTPSIVLTLPVRSPEPPKFIVDGTELKPERVRQARPDSGEFRLDIGGLSPNPERILTVSYRDPNGSPCGFVSLHHLHAPVFPENTSIGPLVWDVVFPYEQFLFLDPSGFSPEFRWQRQSFLWSRGPTPLAADAANWIGTKISSVGDEGNPYAFSRFGGVPTIVVGSMAQSFVIFVGAGISLLAAFILMKLPVARTPLTLFVFAFLAAIAYLWSAETVRLLLQPALFGMLLAILAAAIDARMQRRRAPFLLAAPSAADFVASQTSPSSIERAIVVTADPEAPTISRPGSRSGVQPVSASDRGSGS